ncbi:unnamed protein product [Lactuca saligna]|uniref:Uncharacterized protein n=1 Tax=Lactuca saligna TaxID=75948 RepID=A0AA35Z0F3_LACSI|nr:unnamed protein product [Lactuca saligna]
MKKIQIILPTPPIKTFPNLSSTLSSSVPESDIFEIIMKEPFLSLTTPPSPPPFNPPTLPLSTSPITTSIPISSIPYPPMMSSVETSQPRYLSYFQLPFSHTQPFLQQPLSQLHQIFLLSNLF